MLFFFFSSRRRHTRFDCDWSSDVCSSDLYNNQFSVDLPLQVRSRDFSDAPPEPPPVKGPGKTSAGLRGYFSRFSGGFHPIEEASKWPSLLAKWHTHVS